MRSQRQLISHSRAICTQLLTNACHVQQLRLLSRRRKIVLTRSEAASRAVSRMASPEPERLKAEAVNALIAEMVTGPSEQIARVRNALERGWEGELPTALQAFQERRHEEIERVCSRYYAEFLGSVQELLKAKHRSGALRDQVVQLDEEIKDTTEVILKLGTNLQKHKLMSKNINTAAVVVGQCRGLTKLMILAKQQIDESRLYPALRTIDNITYQLSIALAHPFAKKVNVWLPELACQIKAVCLRDVTQWLVEVRSKSVSIGRGALRKCCRHMSGQSTLAYGLSATTVTQPGRQLVQQVHQVLNNASWIDEEEVVKSLPTLLLEAGEVDLLALNSMSESLDPLHRALHIHARLGALGEFKQFYMNNRLPQATIPPSLSGQGPRTWLDQYQDVLAYSAAFFVIERTALEATDYPDGLLSAVKLEETWAAIQRDLCQRIESDVARLTNPAQFIQLKQGVVLLAYTLGEDCFHYNTQPLMDQLRNLGHRYQAVQLAALQAACRGLLQEELFQPLSIQSEKEMMQLITPFGLGSLDTSVPEDALDPLSVGASLPGLRRRKAVHYPRSFPFSGAVPGLSLQLYKAMFQSLLFGFQLQLSTMDVVLMQLTEGSTEAITRLLNHEVSMGLQNNSNFPISKACQISVDAVALRQMLSDFESTLTCGAARFYSAEAASKVPEVMRKAKRSMENVSIAAQDAVFELIQRKIDELLGGMCFIDWESGMLQKLPRSYVEDIISYLQVTFMCLTYLPKTAREAIHFASCSHINSAMMDALADGRGVKSINANGLYNFSVDVAALEEFADQCGTMQLRECFAELRQTLGTLLHRDINTIMLNATLREGVYPKIHTAKLISILERYKPVGVISQVKNQQRTDSAGIVDLPYLDKKKVTDYLKALHTQQAASR